MSRKPPKKSNMGKSWMKPRRDSRQMISPEYHLIVSEGTKTEPKYFRERSINNQLYEGQVSLPSFQLQS